MTRRPTHLKQLTIRGFDPDVAEEVRELARRERLSLNQAVMLPETVESGSHRLPAYVVLSLLSCVRTEEAQTFGAGLRTNKLDYAHFFPGTLVMILLFTAIFATISIIEDRREGFLQRAGIRIVAQGRNEIRLRIAEARGKQRHGAG